MARAAGQYHLPDDAKPMFDLYYKLYAATDGKCTPLIGQVLVDAGYDANYSLQVGTFHASGVGSGPYIWISKAHVIAARTS